MKKTILKIFWKVTKLNTLLLSALGFCLGISFVLIGLKIYQNVFSSFSSELEKSDFVVLSKDVVIFNTILNSKSVLEQREIDSLQKQPFVEKIGFFTPNHFRVWARVSAGGGLEFATELFFESVADEFVDSRPSNFRWSDPSDPVPIIVSEDFINLYNYGYAISSGLPQISKGTVALIPLEIELSGPNGKQTFSGKIVGYSERISSVLVPLNFMQWANKNIGGFHGIDKPSRLIVKTNKKYAGGMDKYLSSNNLLINSDKLGTAKLNAWGKILVDILMVIGLAFVLFSFVIVLLNFSLIITEAKSEILLLLQLGYTTATITKHLWFYMAVYMTIVFAFSAVVYYSSYTYLNKILTSRGLFYEDINSKSPLLLLLLSYLILNGLGYLFIMNNIRKRNKV